MNVLPPTPSSSSTCGVCREESSLFPFSMAFQPIVDTSTQTVFAYEALCRGLGGEPAHTILSQVTEENRYAFDQSCRVKAITLAAQLGLARHGARLSVNFMPGAVYSPAACIQRTLRAARETGFPLGSLIFEITEDERVRDSGHLAAIVSEYKKHGFALAMDDFGAGYSGLNLLAELEVDIIKLDLRLVRNLDRRARAEAIVRSILTLCRELKITVIAECVETHDEYTMLRSLGVTLMQGYLFARPAFEALPEIVWPASRPAAAFSTRQSLTLPGTPIALSA